MVAIEYVNLYVLDWMYREYFFLNITKATSNSNAKQKVHYRYQEIICWYIYISFPISVMILGARVFCTFEC